MRLALALLAACSPAATPAATAPAAPPAPPAPIGKLAATSELSGTVQQIRATGTEVPLADLRQYLGSLGLPVSGTANVDLSIDVPNGSAALISGHAHLTCTKCRIGDDVAKLQYPGKSAASRAFAGEGIEFGHLDFDKIDIAVAIENGTAEIKTFAVSSPDLAIEVTGKVDLATTATDSAVSGCIRFKPSAALQTSSPKTFTVLSLTGAPLGPDGYYSIRLAGTLGDMKRLGEICH